MLLAAATVISFSSLVPLLIMLATDVFVIYFLFSSLFAYAELREDCLYIKFGFVLKREIPYSSIRELKKERKVIAETMLSIKNALDHTIIKYNKFDAVTISVIDNDSFILAIEERIKNNHI